MVDGSTPGAMRLKMFNVIWAEISKQINRISTPAA
jgi:hypothetical protein